MGRRGWGLALLLGIAIGVIGWGGLNTVLDLTNHTAFCISCHAMRDTVYVEYRTSPHYRNASGVRAECADCHVPRGWLDKVIRKAQATNEVYHWLVGSIATPEKFAARRHILARHEWQRMQASDSRECRNCHSYDAMDPHQQPAKAAKAMADAAKAGKTCIDCHKGIAHTMPDVAAGHRAKMVELRARALGLSFQLNDKVQILVGQPVMAPDGVVIGEILAGTPAIVRAIRAEGVAIEVTGWWRGDATEQLYARAGERQMLVRLTTPAPSPRPTGRDWEDSYHWTEVSMTLVVPAGGLLPASTELWHHAAAMYDANCSLCHALHPPNRYAANDWIGHVNAMRRLTPLNEEEGRLLLAYLQQHARR